MAEKTFFSQRAAVQHGSVAWKNGIQAAACLPDQPVLQTHLCRMRLAERSV